ncbi:MAG TPA: hypothetical protein PKG60_06990 [Spirochaetota bacterium]|nr:hypothetical protein [Spirochaetota bacterium]HPS85295.1 hypothetical protein [Spirochaetota bacterium]
MKKTLVLITGFLIIISAALAADKDTSAVDFVKTLINKAAAENGYTNALRFFQYTATTEKNNPYSYVLSKWGKDALNESGLQISDKGKYIPVLSNRSGTRIGKLWNENKEELFKLLSAQTYDNLLKSEVDSLIAFRSSPDYNSLMKKMKTRSKKPGVKTLDIAGAVTVWDGYKQLSFWYRRDFEKNDKVVFEILKELKTHYEK